MRFFLHFLRNPCNSWIAASTFILNRGRSSGDFKEKHAQQLVEKVLSTQLMPFLLTLVECLTSCLFHQEGWILLARTAALESSWSREKELERSRKWGLVTVIASIIWIKIQLTVRIHLNLSKLFVDNTFFISFGSQAFIDMAIVSNENEFISSGKPKNFF